ncbi:MAG TPA: PD-(D/E)XK nuclease family protein [Candidatus Saccharimonadales bacterium]|nr:PD-(D/E)XK nuclease family protein [Candidatus Saccharimonadales bacterium]
MNYWSQRNQPYMPGQTCPFKVSRSKIELFMQCPRCFWLDIRLKIKRPASPPFNINKAIDGLLKKEFDTYRVKGEAHPLMLDNQIKAIPYAHKDLDKWRENFVGVTTLHKSTNLHVFGAVDDLWVNEAGEVIVVDYKATAKDKDVNIDAAWQISYKRQMEVYQWLLRQNGLTVSPIGYFVYCNGRLDLDGFNNHLEFTTKLISYAGDDSWVEPILLQMKDCMERSTMPAVGSAAMGGECDFCSYARSRTELTLRSLHNRSVRGKSS